MNIGIIGHGKMGRAIEEILLERGHKVVFALERTPSGNDLEKTDVAIEFTQPRSAETNIKSCLEYGIPVVSGTTGWLSNFSRVKKYCLAHKGAFLYASNFSLGVNLFFELNKQLAKLISLRKEYSCQMEEIHHTQKLDAPSGTAITLAESIIEYSDYSNWTLGDFPRSDKLEANTIPICAKRIGNTPGTHTIQYHCEEDSLTISHLAHGRKGFALGAIIAAEWIVGRQGVFGMNDVLNIS